MSSKTLGWQSWSPPLPHWSGLPRRDYAPPSHPHTPLSISPATSPQISLTYWCTWYGLGYFPSYEAILAQANFIKSHNLPIKYILLDDGWRLDWLPQLSKELHRLDFRVGLWYAPFTRHLNLPLYKTLDKLISLGNLDLLKLDFLYKPYFLPRLYPSPSKTLQSLFSYLNTHYPHLVTIGCGVPFTDSVGRLAIIRLSKDTALPPPTPSVVNRLFYSGRIELLFEKYQVWEKTRSFTADPDVRMFGLDSLETNRLWSKMNYTVRGVGDNLLRLTPAQLHNLHLWPKP